MADWPYTYMRRAWSPAWAQPLQDRLTQLYQGVWTEIYAAAWHEQLFTIPPSLVYKLR